MGRGTTHAAAHALHMILTANDDRARTMHAVAARTDRELLRPKVAALLDRNDQRRADRAQAWRQHSAPKRVPARPPTNALAPPDSTLRSADVSAVWTADTVLSFKLLPEANTARCSTPCEPWPQSQ